MACKKVTFQTKSKNIRKYNMLDKILQYFCRVLSFIQYLLRLFSSPLSHLLTKWKEKVKRDGKGEKLSASACLCLCAWLYVYMSYQPK